jgi:hypothetical protein
MKSVDEFAFGDSIQNCSQYCGIVEKNEYEAVHASMRPKFV